MAAQSRNQRHKARQRRNISLLTRELKQARSAHFNAHLTVLMLLAQQGGEATVVQGTMQQVVQSVQELNWESVLGKVPNEFIIRIITKEEASAETQSLPATDGEATAPIDSAFNPQAIADREESSENTDPRNDATGYVGDGAADVQATEQAAEQAAGDEVV